MNRGLQFSGPKTVAVLFTHNRVFRTPPLLGWGTLNYHHIRYLGVELDSKLTWKRHVLEKVKIAKFKLMHVRRAIGKLWGP